jgi:hypothetical protein
MITATDQLCNGCKKPMWVEGYIEDNINLCHECYCKVYVRKDI